MYVKDIFSIFSFQYRISETSLQFLGDGQGGKELRQTVIKGSQSIIMDLCRTVYFSV